MKPYLDYEKQDAICTVISLGGTRAMAAQYVGCHVRTIYAHAKRDPEFARRLEKTALDAELESLELLKLARQDPKHWRAAAWTLERLHPHRYGPRSPNSFTSEQVGQIIEQVMVAISKQVPVKRYRRAIRTKVHEIVACLPAPPKNKSRDAS